MTQRDSGNNIDPFEPWRAMQGANINMWANMMAEAMRTDRMSQAMTNFFDTYVAASTQFQKTIEQYMSTVFPRSGLPAQTEIADLSGRINQLEQALVGVETKTMEQLSGLPAQLAELEQQMQELPQQLATFGQQLRTLPERIDNLEQRFRALSEQLTNVDQALQALPERINDLEQRVQAFPEQLASFGQPLHGLPERIDNLEQRAQAFPELLAGLDQQVRGLPERVSNLEQRFLDVPEQLLRVDQHVQAVPGRIAALEQRLDDLTTTINQQVEGITGQLNESSTQQQDEQTARSAGESRIQALHDNVAELRQVVEALRAEQPAPPAGRRRRSNETT